MEKFLAQKEQARVQKRLSQKLCDIKMALRLFTAKKKRKTLLEIPLSVEDPLQSMEGVDMEEAGLDVVTRTPPMLPEPLQKIPFHRWLERSPRKTFSHPQVDLKDPSVPN